MTFTNLTDECNTDVQDCDYLLEDENPLTEYQFNPEESLIYSAVISIATSEGKNMLTVNWQKLWTSVFFISVSNRKVWL